MLPDSNFKVVYSTGDHEPTEFFIEALLESKSFDLGLGFFSSSGFRALSLGFAYFISHGGRMRMIINHFLSSNDKDAIQRGQVDDIDNFIAQSVLKDFFHLKNLLSRNDEHFFRCLSLLIAEKRLELIAVTPNNEYGIAHQKYGVFTDDSSNKVVFVGSINMSETALFYNIESLSCYRSWLNEVSEIERINIYSSMFEKTWNGLDKNIRYVPLNDVQVYIKEKFPVSDINKLIEEENLIICKELKFKLPPHLIEKLEDANRKVIRKNSKVNIVKLPSTIKVRGYQENALSLWKENNYQGFFEMATGTGKTFTGLLCSIALKEKLEKIFLLILVPTISLAEQWKFEVTKFNYKNIHVISSDYPEWKSELLNEINSFKLGNREATVLISTYDSFKLKYFQEHISKFPPETMLIADEAHIMGAAELRKKTPHSIIYRLGLSATPHRHFDDSGTQSLLKYFKSEFKSTFIFSMKEAIGAQYLCQYKLYPYFVQLNGEEYTQYISISKEIARRAHINKQKFIETDSRLEKLLRDRRNILNKAENKLEVVGKIVDDLKAKGEIHHTLVYCPEGNDSTEDSKIIDSFGRYLGLSKGLKIGKFIGETTSERRQQLLEDFDSGKIQCLLAMKCLDEGVDVRRTETAIFVSSTTNPRQYIQRRGRVLRTHQKKSFAYLYDIMAVPPKNFDGKKEDEIEKLILQQEFRRYKEFAEDAINFVEALTPVKEICDEYNIEI